MDKVMVAIIRHEILEKLSSALKKEKITFMYSEVKGFCKEVHLYHGDIQKRIRIEIITKDTEVNKVKDKSFQTLVADSRVTAASVFTTWRSL